MKPVKQHDEAVSQEQLEQGLATIAFIYQLNQAAYADILLLADRLEQAVKEIKQIGQKQANLSRYLQSWQQKHQKPEEKKQPYSKQPPQQMDLFGFKNDKVRKKK